jgi:hypothetical protein
MKTENTTPATPTHPTTYTFARSRPAHTPPHTIQIALHMKDIAIRQDVCTTGRWRILVAETCSFADPLVINRVVLDDITFVIDYTTGMTHHRFLHAHLHLHVALSRRTNGRSLGTFRNAKVCRK